MNPSTVSTALSILLSCLGLLSFGLILALFLGRRPRYIEAVREDTGDFDA